MFRILFAAVGVLAGLAPTQTFGADIPFFVYSTLNPAGTFNGGTGYTIGGSVLQAHANRFVPTAGGALFSIDLGLQSAAAPQPVVVQLLLDNGFGLPGAVIASGTITVSIVTGPGDSTSLTSFFPSETVMLSKNTAYWVAVLPVSTIQAVWNDTFASIGAGATMQVSFPWGLTQPNPSLQQAFRVSAVPEPSALFLSGFAGAGLGLLRWKRRKHAIRKGFDYNL